jgi:pyrimidine-nucleoside phosphorylase
MITELSEEILMRMYDLIEKKKMGQVLTSEEINWFIEYYTKGEIPDYQVSALLMAIYFQGMNNDETVALTMAMAKSGDMLDLSEIKGIKVDKHSTGGVGDKTSLVVAPMVSALGVPVAKMSGRGLGHTGGTIDKLESFPGFTTSISEETFIENVNTIKIAIAGQTANLAPADKKLYALRDVTATVDQISLIASSIMSKKIASGANAIVLDVKTGSGAFMREEKDAILLAKTMVEIGKGLGRKTTAVISDMNQPLGYAVGNNLEVIEAINTLKGNGPQDLLEISLELGSRMVYFAEKATSIEEAREKLMETIHNGTALEQFKKFIHAQGGDESYVDNTSQFPVATIVEEVTLQENGFISHIETEEIGFAAMMLGGGRETKESIIDLSVGFVIHKKIGDKIQAGESLATIYGNSREQVDLARKRFVSAYTLSQKTVDKVKFIKEIIS